MRELRAYGKSPALPIFVTDNWVFNGNMERMGALSIMVRPQNSSENWDAVAGMDVILCVKETEEIRPLVRAVRDARPRRLRNAGNGLTTMWGPL